MIEFLKNIDVGICNPEQSFTVGLHLQKGQAFEMDEEGIVNENTAKDVYMFIIGFLFFHITFYW